MAELGIKTCIVDDKGTRALNGRTDGFHARTAEIWDSFGLHGVLREHGVQLHEWCLWVCFPTDRLSLQSVADCYTTGSDGKWTVVKTEETVDDGTRYIKVLGFPVYTFFIYPCLT
jgi:hypothetical protein